MKRGLEKKSIDLPVCRVHKCRILWLGGSGGDAPSGNFWNIVITRLNLEAIFNQILKDCGYKMDEFSCKQKTDLYF